jgi:hypothetical protein
LVHFSAFFGGLERVGYSFAYVAHFVLLGDAWIRTQRAAVASRCATNLANHLPISTYLAILNSNSNINYCKKGRFYRKEQRRYRYGEGGAQRLGQH